MSRTRHLLYIDESGGHDLKHVDPNWPVFVLVGLLVGETYYARTLVARVRELKRRHGLSVSTVLHSRSIRRHEGPFQFLQDEARREAFYSDVNALFEGSRISLYAVVINKWHLAQCFLLPPNPYDVSLSHLMNATCGPPGLPTRWRPNVVQITAESRGKNEDKQLQATYQNFRRLGLASYGAIGVRSRRPQTVGRVFPGRIGFVKKSKVVAGLELADLAAYPIGRASVNDQWENPAYLAVSSKLKALVAFP